MSVIRCFHSLALAACCVSSGCASLVGIDELIVGPSKPQTDHATLGGLATSPMDGMPCDSHQQCNDASTSLQNDGAPALCVAERCVTLLSADCPKVSGDYTDNNAIVIASLFSTSGPQATTNRFRERAAMLAVNEVNASGGIPAGPVAGTSRSLVMLSCDESQDLERVAEHLMRDLKIAAIVGPNTSQDTIDIATRFSVKSGTLLISPTAVASGIADLLDDNLVWSLVPSDRQRAPLMLAQIGAIAQQLSEEGRSDNLRLSIVYRDDALGAGVRSSLSELVFNGEPLGSASNLGNNVRAHAYDYRHADQTALLTALDSFSPDIIVLAGTAEAIISIMLPLEDLWKGRRRPHYLLTDSSKVPELLEAVTGNDGLRRRVRGVGARPEDDSLVVSDAFKLAYEATYPTSAAFSGMGTAYDATYAIAYSLAATYDVPVTGKSLALGLRRLSTGAVVQTGRASLLEAFRRLVTGDTITAVGTMSRLTWDPQGAVSRGLLEVWCIEGGERGVPAFASAGIAFDIASNDIQGEFRPCAP